MPVVLPIFKSYIYLQSPALCGAFLFLPTFEHMDQIAIIGNSPERGLHESLIQKSLTISNIDSQIEPGKGGDTVADLKYGTTLDEWLSNDPYSSFLAVFTPTGYHAELAIKALQAGKHVILSGPLSITEAASWQMIETEKFCRRSILSIRPWMLRNEVQELIGKVKNGLKIKSFHWKAIRSHTAEYLAVNGSIFPHGGVLYHEFFDAMDLLSALLGNFIEANGIKERQEPISGYELETRAAVTVKTESGVKGTLEWEIALQGSAGKDEVRIETEEGSMVFQNQTLELEMPLILQQFYADLDILIRQGSNGPFGSLQALRTVQNINAIYKGLSTAKPLTS
ncbi:MAG TPA: Gfo/Idh/MocA family oxidoreductase [Flavisolibacter sp.]|jgi:predicted dehydrogenase|nr:Gfo/Idh/MocA family oxidoreductase [Flavisolibacter sp.]